MYLMFSLQIDTSENLLKLDYKLLIIYNIQQYDSNNRIKNLASYSNKFLAFTLDVLTGYITRYDSGYDEQPIKKYGFTFLSVKNQVGSSNYLIVFTSYLFL